MRRKLLALAILLAVGGAALAVGVGGLGASATTATEYLTSEATVGDVTDQVAATGSLAAAITYGLAFGSSPFVIREGDEAPASETSWPVTDVAVKPGDTVTVGQVLATANATAAKRAYDRATNDLRTANMQHALATDQLADARDADDATPSDRRCSRSTRPGTRSRRRPTHVGPSQPQLAAATLRAPIDGIVTAVNVSRASTRPAARPSSSPRRPTRSPLTSSSATSPTIEVGQQASVTIDAIGTTVEGTVTAISPTAGDSSSGVVAYPVTVALEEAPPDARARDERRHHDHDRVCDRRADRAERRTAGHQGRLRGHDPRRRRHPAASAGPGRSRHQRDRRDHQRTRGRARPS